MGIHRTAPTALLLWLTLAPASAVLAHSSGVSSNEFSASQGCNQCHSSGSFSPTVTFSGSTKVAPGATVTYTFTVKGGGSQLKAGFNVATPTGKLSYNGDTGTKEITNTNSGLVEITHPSAQTMDSSSTRTFSFKWTAPSSFTTAVLTGWGNAVNGNNNATGDLAKSTTFTISICPDSDGDTFRDLSCGGTDCDDSSKSINPGAQELCNGIDDNCNGKIDESGPNTYYKDADGDGYGNPTQSTSGCSTPAGYVSTGNDCDDANKAINPGATETCNGIDDDCDGAIDEGVKSPWYRDADGDGYGTSNTSTTACSQPSGYVDLAGDCNDSNKAVNPDATEVCNGIDDNCNNSIDEGVRSTFYRDADGDGYGTATTSTTACSAPPGYVSVSGDCNDANKAVNPGATEVCNGIDDNCSGAVDEGFTSSTWYKDLDGDSYGGSSTTTNCIQPTGYVSRSGDCNDASAAINPGATELCNGIDDNCDGQVDEGVSSTTWFKDADGDGYGISDASTTSCVQPTGYASKDGDCDDTNKNVHPGAAELCNGFDDNCDGSIDEGVSATLWYRDADGDGYGTFKVSTSACVQPAGYVSQSGDCDDSSSAVDPAATEVCNGIDDDCDGQIDEGFASTTWYKDADGDGFGLAGATTTTCAQPAGYIAKPGDCDDSSSTSYPGAPELCNGVDDNCNGQVDETKATWYKDGDGDGYGVSTATTIACSQPQGYASQTGDCDDASKAVHPGAMEVCNGIDDNCNGQSDEGLTTSTWYLDLDGDGYGVSTTTTADCAQPVGYAAKSGDCNDAVIAVNPGATEICNGIDDDCDGQVDEGVTSTTYYMDSDGDGYGNSSISVTGCKQLLKYVPIANDCDDTNKAVNPGATETCNGIDDNCNGQIDDGVLVTWYRDLDGDGYGASQNAAAACTQPSGYVARTGDCNDSSASVNPGAVETCNGIDDNCNGQLDEGLASPTWYRDADGDGYGGKSTTSACSQPTGYVALSGDCDDSGSTIHPGATETCNSIDDDCDGQLDEGVLNTFYPDADKDGFGANTTTTQACSAPEGYVSASGDCDDSSAAVNPGVTEVAEACGDGIDQDCNGQDLSCAEVDRDGDGQTPLQGDCNDADPVVYLEALEICGDGIDQDCDGSDLSCAQVDQDGDGQSPILGDCDDTDPSIYQGAIESAVQCDDGIDQDCNGQDLSCASVDRDGDGQTPVQGDCDDTDPARYPGAAEVPYDAIDQDCDGIDLVDVDQDGHPAAQSGGDDCDDLDASTYPGALEVCGDGKDNDCGGTPDDLDADGDGYRATACGGDDCDDSNPAVHPEAGEVPDGVDNNCDGRIDEGTSVYDDDGDGYSESKGDCDDSDGARYPGADDLCGDGIDQDCNGADAVCSGDDDATAGAGDDDGAAGDDDASPVGVSPTPGAADGDDTSEPGQTQPVASAGCSCTQTEAPHSHPGTAAPVLGLLAIVLLRRRAGRS